LTLTQAALGNRRQASMTFSTREFARLLVMRRRVHAGPYGTVDGVSQDDSGIHMHIVIAHHIIDCPARPTAVVHARVIAAELPGFLPTL
jgi:hypothetical protein